jgi:Uma2 family endonuclease
MTTEILEKFYTIEEFLKLDLPEDEDYELIRGRIVARQGTTSAKHGDITSRISTEISNFAGYSAGEKQTGLVFVGASTNLGNPQGKNFPKPDVCFVLKERLPDDLKVKYP